MTAPVFKRRWFQFSLRTLLVFVTLCAIPCSWLAVRREHIRRQREAIKTIEGLGGLWAYSDPTDHSWVDKVLDDNCPNVVCIHLDLTEVTDDQLGKCAEFTQLEVLTLPGCHITDAGLAHVQGLNRLEFLDLSDTSITDMGLERIQGFMALEGLVLRGTGITDMGLKHLRGFKNLRRLYLESTSTTKEAVEHLKEALPKCKIYR
jgi:hypothetical protein